MSHYHALIWIDHLEARVFHFNREHADREVLHAARPDVHVHHKAGDIGPGKVPQDHSFFRAAAEAVAESGEVLIVGPGEAKQLFVRWIERREPGLRGRVVGTVTVDHPTDPQLIALARRYFLAADRMRPQRA